VLRKYNKESGLAPGSPGRGDSVSAANQDGESPGQDEAGVPEKESDTIQPAAKQPDAKQPDAKQPDAKQPDAKQPDAKQPDAKPDGK